MTFGNMFSSLNIDLKIYLNVYLTKQFFKIVHNSKTSVNRQAILQKSFLV